MNARVGSSTARRRTARTAMAALGIAVALTLTACSDGGPAPLADGTYRLFATSESGTSEGVVGGELVLAGDTVTVTSEGEEVSLTLGDAAGTYVVCPPSQEGSPLALGGPANIGGIDMTEPAIYGDCGETSPARVTVVDLADIDESQQFVFTRWAEFCDVTDPDC